MPVALPAVKELGPNHVCLDQSDPNVVKIAKSLPWYGPAHSPHDVPSFYDVSGITENPEVFQLVVDFFVERYRAQARTVPLTSPGSTRAGSCSVPPSRSRSRSVCDDPQAGKLPGVLVSSKSSRVQHGRDRHASGYPRAIAWCWWTISSPPVAPPRGFRSRGHARREGARVRGDGVAAFPGRLEDSRVRWQIQGRELLHHGGRLEHRGDMCRDPPAGTPRVVAAEEAKEWAEKMPRGGSEALAGRAGSPARWQRVSDTTRCHDW